MSTPSFNRRQRRLARPGLWIVAGGLAVGGALLASLVHPVWAGLAVLGGLALIFAPDLAP
jgi:hypothetical protein